ncbi:MAG: ABC transporter permease [Gammaproteobacteria bacterium RBG_16_51_14]|nr:MAG: ABC transporter permease [Gammaproteobacteria bacterium RBG_16_51_14]
MRRFSLPAIIILVWGLIALIGPVLPLDPNRIELAKILGAPEWQAWLGYDDLGRSIGQRLIMGAHTSFLVASGVVMVSFLSGTLLGMLGAWFGGPWDKGLVSIIDIFIAFPGILLAIALAGLLGPGLMNAVVALAVTGWVGFARLARAQTLSMKHRDHVEAARALGSGTVTIVSRHLLPLILAPLIIEATFAIAGVVIAEASLSFLGLGVQPPGASWGSMIRDGTRYMLVAPHMVLAPGLAIFLVVIAINLLGDRLRDAMDIKEISANRE